MCLFFLSLSLATKDCEGALDEDWMGLLLSPTHVLPSPHPWLCADCSPTLDVLLTIPTLPAPSQSQTLLSLVLSPGSDLSVLQSPMPWPLNLLLTSVSLLMRMLTEYPPRPTMWPGLGHARWFIHLKKD